MMLAAILESPGQMIIREIEDPPISSGDCVVSVCVAAVCSTDARHFRGDATRLRLGRPPILGHEIYGRILAGGTTGLAQGTAVAIVGSEFCRKCSWCLRSDFLSCPFFRISTGGFAGIIVVPSEWSSWRVFPLPPDADAIGACYLDSVSCSLRALRLGGVTEETRVIVLGDGFMAALTAVNAKHLGAQVLLVSHSSRIEALMEEFGIRNIVLNRGREKELMDFSGEVLVDAGSAIQERTVVWSSLAHAAKIVVMSGSPTRLPNIQTIYEKRIAVLPSFHSDLLDRRAGVAALQAIGMVVKRLSEEYPFGMIQKALESVCSKACFRCHVRFDDRD